MQSQKPRQGYKLVKWLYEKEIEIPEEWEIKKIKDLTKVSVGLVINPSTYFDKNGTIPMITGKNVTENGIVLNDVDCITEKSNKLLETTRIWSGDLVTMRVGYPGRTSVVTKEHDGINCASVIITRENKKFVSQFLGYLTNSKLVSKQIMMHQAGGAQQVVNIGSWKEFVIPFPPIHEQQKIASILSNVDSLIQQTQKILEQTQRLKKGLMQKLLTKGIGHTKFRTITLGPKFPKITVPDDWRVEKLSHVAKVIDSRHYTPKYIEKGIPLILPNNVKIEGLDLTETKFTSNDDYQKLIDGERNPEIGDIVYSRNATFGIACRVDNTQNFSVGQDLVLIKPRKIDPYLLFLILNSNIIWTQLSRLVTGTTFKRINLDLIRDFIIPYSANPVEQLRISELVKKIDFQISFQNSYKSKLENLKKGLMQKLLTGQIRVKI